MYGTGDEDQSEPGTYTKVLYKSFSNDFDDKIEPLPAPPKPDPTPDIVDEMAQMNAFANTHAIDLVSCFEELLGIYDSNARVRGCTELISREKFRQVMGVVLSKAAFHYHIDAPTLDAICECYGGGARVVDNGRRAGQYESVQWREFAKDVNELQERPWAAGSMREDNIGVGATGGSAQRRDRFGLL